MAGGALKQAIWGCVTELGAKVVPKYQARGAVVTVKAAEHQRAVISQRKQLRFALASLPSSLAHHVAGLAPSPCFPHYRGFSLERAAADCETISTEFVNHRRDTVPRCIPRTTPSYPLSMSPSSPAGVKMTFVPKAIPT